MLSPAERRTLAQIERQLAADGPVPGRYGHPALRWALLAARVLIAVLAAVGVVAGVVVARIDIVVLCAATFAATEAVLRRSG